jgi:nucleotide-binding universal stress UspA family protein
MLKKVLVPLHFHESKDYFTKMFRFLQELGTDRAVLLHVGSNKGRGGAHNRARLTRYAEHIEGLGVRTELAVRPGSVQLEIVYAAEEFEADYISFSFRKKNRLSLAILGSTVKDVIRQSRIPVFVFKGTGRSEDDLFRVLYPSSLKWKDDVIASYIRNNEFRANEVDFLYVGKRAPDPVVEQQRRDRVEEELQELSRRCGYSEENSSTLNLLGSPRKQIVRVARRRSSNLVLLGKADSMSSREPVLGSTAEEVSYNAPCSVLIVPRDGGMVK